VCGLEALQTIEQIKFFTKQLKQQVDDPILDSINFKDWESVFTYITNNILGKKKLIMFFDEIQWMAAGRKKLLSIIKYFWDNFWKEKNIMLILCGSTASFMVDQVLHSKALYGRIDLEILLKGLKPNEAKLFFSERKSKEEILKYLIVIGTIPKYLEFIKQNKSFSKNINELFFDERGKLFNEIDKVFYSQFKESKIYLNIVKLLKSGIFTLKEISTKINIKSGGGLKRYLSNLTNAEVISSYISYNKKSNSKLRKYRISDEYLQFYFKYVEPNKRIIKESNSSKLFETLTKKGFNIWMGIQFEKFCLKNSLYLAEIMGFEEEVLIASPLFNKEDNKGFQIDLIYLRSDNIITVCEIKYWDKEVNKNIIKEVERKISLLDIPRGYSVETALISIYGEDKSLKERNFFDYSITINDIFK